MIKPERSIGKSANHGLSSRFVSYVLDRDSSDYGIGVVLSQIQGGGEKVIAYRSRILKKRRGTTMLQK